MILLKDLRVCEADVEGRVIISSGTSSTVIFVSLALESRLLIVF
jgi:hypothetical protein